MGANKKKNGFTLVEVMIVITIMGLLAMVAVPNTVGVIERVRENIDLLKLFYLKEALNRALVETESALTNSTCLKNGSEEDQQKRLNNLSSYLSSDVGLTLFVMELRNDEPVNFQTKHGSANANNNMYKDNDHCNIAGSGTWYYALKEAGLEAVADIIEFRSTTVNNGGIVSYRGKEENQKKLSEALYNVKETDDGQHNWRTYPKTPVFISRALNYGPTIANSRLTRNFQWTGKNAASRSVEVYFLPHNKKWNQAFKTRHGVCFSTYGQAGCTGSVPGGF